MDYCNKNGLVDGKIPKGKACPFATECERIIERCPTETNKKDNDFSCALARLISATKKDS